MQNKAVDIVIPTRNRGARIDATIASIRVSNHREFTLWVIDQSDNDETEYCVMAHAREDERIRYVRVNSRGISAARNAGLEAGAAPFILFTDDDCRIDPDWVAHMVYELDSQQASAVFGRIIGETTDHQILSDNTVGTIMPLATKRSVRRKTYVGNRLNLAFGHGANMGIRRDAYESLFGFDELLGVGGKLSSWEDRDFGYRLLKQGNKITYTPDALVYHAQWRSWQAVRRAQRDYSIGAGAAAAKYVRSGDMLGWFVLLEWMVSQGLRQASSGLFKWRSKEKIVIGFLNLYYTLVGFARSYHYSIDTQRCLYRQQVEYAILPPL